MISVDGLTVEFGGSALFSDVSFVINEKDRIALMGKNGAGKSTLLKIDRSFIPSAISSSDRSIPERSSGKKQSHPLPRFATRELMNVMLLST